MQEADERDSGWIMSINSAPSTLIPTVLLISRLNISLGKCLCRCTEHNCISNQPTAAIITVWMHTEDGGFRHVSHVQTQLCACTQICPLDSVAFILSIREGDMEC